MAGKQELMAVSQANSEFTKGLYKILSKQPGNVFFSPISAHAVLSMALQGAEGQTKEVMEKSLGVSTPIAAEGYKSIMHHLKSIGNVQLDIANKVYLKQGSSLKSNFKEVSQSKFSSEVEQVDFTKNEAAAKNINQWVEQKTHDKIKDLIQSDDLDSDTRLVLVNAIYFKGSWIEKFDEKLTQNGKFWLDGNNSIEVPMMHKKTNKFRYKESEELNAQVLEMPYSNPDVSLVIILPKERDGIADLEKRLMNVQLEDVTKNMWSPEVVVTLPRFKIETTIPLNEPLTELGLGQIFTNAANFSGMLESPEPLAVSKVIQKAFIEVNEEGTEAAAATGASIMLMSAMLPQDPVNFTADHPFIALLKTRGWVLDEKRQAKEFVNTLSVLFTGRVTNPSS